MSFFTVFLLFILIAALAVLRNNYLADRRVERLEDIPPLEGGKLPSVSVIIPACNEEQGIATALTSVLNLDYPDLEIIVLNDRSTDSTPEILDRLAREYPRLRVIHIRELPAGWLGKNHALHLGAAEAEGEYLLFTDADVHLASDTLRRAVARMETRNLDFLCLLFRMIAPGHLLSLLIADSLSTWFTLLKPWLIPRQESPYFMGIGAFNLVRRSSYEGFCGHRSIRLCPLDDVLLGRIAKVSGGRCDCLNGGRFVSLDWYQSVAAMVHGLRKNTFALIDYRPGLLLGGTAAVLSFQILPLWGLLLIEGIPRLLCAAVVAVNVLALALAARAFQMDLRCLYWFPVTPYIKLYTVWRAMLTTLIRGGIDWRGTFYSLEELRRHKVSVLPWVKVKIRGEEQT